MPQVQKMEEKLAHESLAGAEEKRIIDGIARHRAMRPLAAEHSALSERLGHMQACREIVTRANRCAVLLTTALAKRQH